MNSIPFNLSLGLLLLFFYTSSDAAELVSDLSVSGDNSQWRQCNSQSQLTSKQPSSITSQPSQDAIYLEADTGTIRAKGVSTLQGNVIIQQNDTQFNADNASFDRNNNLIVANGNVILSANNLKFKSRAIAYDLKNHAGTFEQAEYQVGTRGAQGKSHQIKQINRDELSLKDATFSSCPAPNPSWYIKSSEIKLNNKTQKGSARDVTFNVGGTSVFYFPRFSFPLNNNRKSGFLSPNFRLQTNAGVTLPYYFNLAPNYDATVSLGMHERQGFQIDSEFRYLTEKHKGKLEFEFIPEDKSFDNKHRERYKVSHLTTLSKNTHIKLDAEGVSDKDYFKDLSTSLETSSRTSLQRRLEFVHQEDPWAITAAVEDYQIIDTNDSPYAKLPEIRIRYQPKTAPKALKLGAELEFINFDKSDAVTGLRSDLKLSASKKWGNDAWFFKPSLSIESTLYSLNKNIGQSTLSRTLPTITLDSGLFFDRDLSIKTRAGQRNFTQTLEPRVLYSFTPYKNQSKFPVFDTAKTNLSATTQLFSENRFTGKDRIADTNRLTFAVSSRLQDRENGTELLRASIGQVFNLSDRRVTLPNGTIQTGKRSDLVLELTGRLNENFKVATTALWDHDKSRVSNYEFRLNYQDDKKRIANLAFRKLDTVLNKAHDSTIKQVSLSGSIPLNDKWSFVGSVERDIENGRNLETLAGLEYHDCCWKTRLVAKRYLSSDNVSYETPIFIEFELKGLGNIGSGARRELQDKIYGYDDF